MAHKLYVYLSGGRGDAYVTDLWDGLPPEDEGMVNEEGMVVGGEEAAGKEVGRPYRDIFNASSEFATVPINIGVNGDTKNISGRHPAHGAYYIESTTPGAWWTGTDFVVAGAGLMGGDYVTPPGGGTPVMTNNVKVTHSDEIVHRAPRQHFEVHTWLVFKEAGEAGAVFKFRKEQVIGWGKNARAE